MNSEYSPAANPFDGDGSPSEPPVGTVLAYQREGNHGVMLSNVSVRALDGRWYTTGSTARQGVNWQEMWAAIRQHAVGTVRYATAWAPIGQPLAGTERASGLRFITPPFTQEGGPTA